MSICVCFWCGISQILSLCSFFRSLDLRTQTYLRFDGQKQVSLYSNQHTNSNLDNVSRQSTKRMINLYHCHKDTSTGRQSMEWSTRMTQSRKSTFKYSNTMWLTLIPSMLPGSGGLQQQRRLGIKISLIFLPP